MFVTFANIEEPNSLSEEEARDLDAELLRGTPGNTRTQAALKIQRGWEQTGEVNLNDDEKRVLVEVIDRQSGQTGGKAEYIRLLQENMRHSLGEDVH
jgi:hypothetical protein